VIEGRIALWWQILLFALVRVVAHLGILSKQTAALGTKSAVVARSLPPLYHNPAFGLNGPVVRFETIAARLRTG
jgi:hypothetical protein